MDTKKVGDRLIALRGQKTQDAVAKGIGVSTSAYAMYERGERIPRDDVKIRIAKYYNRSVQFIFFNH